MCFIIAGLQPKTRTLDDVPQRCSRCGLHQAQTRRVDHYLSLFFLPLVRVKKGAPFLYCERCEQSVGPTAGAPKEAGLERPPKMCSQCGRTVAPQFNYCPNCGQRQ